MPERDDPEDPRAPKAEGRAPTSSEDKPGTPESDYEDGPLVGGPIYLITMPIELSILGTERKMALTALLDSGCTWCLISPALVEKLGFC